MVPSRSLSSLAGAAAISLTALALAACGGGSTVASSATVQVASTGVGSVLVDSRGHTLYLFKKDVGTASKCAGECASDWPPLRATGAPTAGHGARASLVGTTRRADGMSQVTYNGHPVYEYAGDANAGDTDGQGVTAFGAVWYALGPAGAQVTRQSSESDGDGGSGYGGGYGY